MATREKSNRTLTLVQPANGHDHSPMPTEFAGLYQAGYEAGFARGRGSGYRQGYEAGFEDGRSQRNNFAAPAAVEDAPEHATVVKSRLFGLPCAKCRRLMYSDEARCAYCKAPRARLVEPPSATGCDPEEARKREREAD
jgi:hypothetical protein